MEQDEEKYELLFNSEYVKQMNLEEVLSEGIGENGSFGWLDDIFGRLAVRIADLYQKISDKIHTAKYEPGEELPSIYNIFSDAKYESCLLYTSPSPRDRTRSRMPSSA